MTDCIGCRGIHRLAYCAGLWFAAVVLVSGAVPAFAGAQTLETDVGAHRALVGSFCVGCHSGDQPAGQLTLAGADLDNPARDAETWEKVIRKLRGQAMPPLGSRRPPEEEIQALIGYLETSIDSRALAGPDPGHSTLHRLNRTEYGNAIRDLLGLEIDPTPLLPPDDESYGFDNIADVLRTSPSLMQRYVSASWDISRLAVGNPEIAADSTTYRSRPDLSQDGHMEGMPFGTRGGMRVEHNFPLDGEYEIFVRLWRATADIVRGLEDTHRLEVSVDGERKALITFGGPADRDLSYENPGASALDIDRRLTVRVPLEAGPHTVIATFMPRSDAQTDDILQPFLRGNLDPLGYRGLPAVDRIRITGPFGSEGAGSTPSRQQIFVCRPEAGGGEAEELSCATEVIGTLAARAWRRPVENANLDNLMEMYRRSRNEGNDFDTGIEAAIQLLLTTPEFLFRFEPDPDDLAPGDVYQLDDVSLASRLSFFLWSSIPDDELVQLAGTGRLSDPLVLEQQVRRMLRDPRSWALVENFAGQWLYLRNLRTTVPDFETFPDFDDNLRQAMGRETQLFFESIMREDRSVLDLLDADYTFVNERLARHYGMSGVYGSYFRRVTLDDPERRGLLGQASILTVTSYSTRTSPVLRGKWILTNILGLPPNPPPPNVPALEERSDPSRPTSLRERLEAHVSSPVCAGCHRIMDPIGLALENYDALGKWRVEDEGVPVDPAGTLFNGSRIEGPADLRAMLTRDPEIFASVMTEKMLTYALGRGVGYRDMPAVRKIVRDSAQEDYRFSSIVLGIVRSAPFRMKIVGGEGVAGSAVAVNREQ